MGLPETETTSELEGKWKYGEMVQEVNEMFREHSLPLLCDAMLVRLTYLRAEFSGLIVDYLSDQLIEGQSQMNQEIAGGQIEEAYVAIHGLLAKIFVEASVQTIKLIRPDKLTK